MKHQAGGQNPPFGVDVLLPRAPPMARAWSLRAVTALLVLGCLTPAEARTVPARYRLAATLAGVLPCWNQTRARTLAVARETFVRAARAKTWPSPETVGPIPPAAEAALLEGVSFLRDAPLDLARSPSFSRARNALLRAARQAPASDVVQAAAVLLHLDLDSGDLLEPYRTFLEASPERARIAHRLLQTVGSNLPPGAARWMAESLAAWAPGNGAALHEAALALTPGDPQGFGWLSRALDILRSRPDVPAPVRDAVARDTFLAAAGVSVPRIRVFLDAHPEILDALRSPPADEPASAWDVEGLSLLARPVDVRVELALALELLGRRDESADLRAGLRREDPRESGMARFLPFLQDEVVEARVPELLAYGHFARAFHPGLVNAACTRIAARVGLEFLPLPAVVESRDGGRRVADSMANPLRFRMAESHSIPWGLDRVWALCRNQAVFGNNVRVRRSLADVAVGRRDSDRDGLPDEAEVRLLTRIESPDTDGDGILDGDDAFPQWALPARTDRSAAAAALLRFALVPRGRATSDADPATPRGTSPSPRFTTTRYLETEPDLIAELDSTDTRWIVAEPGRFAALQAWAGPLPFDRMSLVAASPDRTRYVGCFADHDDRRETCATLMRTDSSWTVVPVPILLPGSSSPSAQREARVRPETYAVYSAVLRGGFDWDEDRTLVVVDRTAGPDEPDFLRRGLGDSLAPDVLEDYRSANRTRVPVEDRFEPGVRIVLLPGPEVDGLVGNLGSDWTRYFQRFPRGLGVAVLSQVGFDRGRTRALVFLDTDTGVQSGRGEFLLLEKQGGIWSIQRRLRLASR